MEIVVLGAGAMGCLFGARLFEGGHRVTLVDVWAEHVAAINAGGLALEEGGAERRVWVPARLPGEVAGPPELVLLFTKAFHTGSALAGARPWLGPETRVLTLQNGLGHAEAIEPYADRSRIFLGMTTFPSDLRGPGRVATRGSGVTRIMAADGVRSPFLEAVAEALDGAGFSCRVSEGVVATIWEKVAFNAALNALTALTGSTVGQVADSPEGRALAGQVVAEVIGVARALGIAADPEAVGQAVDGAFREHRSHQPSMLQDVLARRPTEAESIHGAVVREARRAGVPVPVTETLYRLLRTLEQGYLGGGSAPPGP